MEKDDKVLKRAIELFEKDKNKEQDQLYNQQALSELDIPKKYYKQAQSELENEQRQKGRKRKKIIPLLFVILVFGFGAYTTFLRPFFKESFASSPKISDFSYSYNARYSYVLFDIKFVNGAYRKRVLYEIYKPNGSVFKKYGFYAGNKLKVSLPKQPEAGKWTLKLLSKGYFSDKLFYEKQFSIIK